MFHVLATRNMVFHGHNRNSKTITYFEYVIGQSPAFSLAGLWAWSQISPLVADLPLPVWGVELDLAFLDFGVCSRKMSWYLCMFSDCDIELSGSVLRKAGIYVNCFGKLYQGRRVGQPSLFLPLQSWLYNVCFLLRLIGIMEEGAAVCWLWPYSSPGLMRKIRAGPLTSEGSVKLSPFIKMGMTQRYWQTLVLGPQQAGGAGAWEMMSMFSRRDWLAIRWLSVFLSTSASRQDRSWSLYLFLFGVECSRRGIGSIGKPSLITSLPEIWLDGAQLQAGQQSLSLSSKAVPGWSGLGSRSVSLRLQYRK